MLTFFIGYDAREHEAAQVAAYSIKTRTSEPVAIYIMEHMELRRLGLFDRPWRIDEKGQFWDVRDGRPFSTGFSHSRFLAFHLAHALKCTDPCMFIDCDWLFLDDPTDILLKQYKHGDQIGVVNRDRKVEENSVKMDGMVQQNYHRKLWSAMFTFMPSEKLAYAFDPKVVGTYSGRELHGFGGMQDKHFWNIDPAWHFIPSLDEAPFIVKGTHFSEFSPWLNPERAHEAPRLFAAWEAERNDMLQWRAENPDVPLWDNLSADYLTATS